MAVVRPPGSNEVLALYTPTPDSKDVYRVRLGRDHYHVLRLAGEAVIVPGLLDNVQAALDDWVG